MTLACRKLLSTRTLRPLQPLGDIKYDPALAPLPAPSARVLARVERDRAYAEFRLAMLEREDQTE